MNILSPIKIIDTMIGAATTIAEPAAGETAWVASGTYAVGDLRIRATTHRVYSCVQAHTGRTALPENDSAYWLDKSPTLRWAPFDVYTSTAATATTSLTYVLTPGYFNSLFIYGASGSTYSITIKNATGGTVIFMKTGGLSEDPVGWYEYLFSPLKTITKIALTDLPIRPTAEVTITLNGSTVSVGMINVGDYVSLLGGLPGGIEYGATAEPISYSYIKVNADGATTIVKRASATGMRAKVVMSQAALDQALTNIQSVLDTPVSWVASDIAGYAGLNIFGLGSASVSYDGPTHGSLNIVVKGLI